MAARIHLTQNDETRKKIQTSQLLNRLESHVFNDVKMSQTQIKAAEILLKKTLPDLSAIAQSEMPPEEGQKVFGWLPVQQ